MYIAAGCIITKYSDQWKWRNSTKRFSLKIIFHALYGYTMQCNACVLKQNKTTTKLNGIDVFSSSSLFIILTFYHSSYLFKSCNEPMWNDLWQGYFCFYIKLIDQTQNLILAIIMCIKSVSKIVLLIIYIFSANSHFLMDWTCAFIFIAAIRK